MSRPPTLLLVDGAHDLELALHEAADIAHPMRILTASGADEALRIALAERPDLIAMCAGAPGAAETLCRAARAERDLGDAVIAIALAPAGAAARARVIDAGADACLAAPPDPNDVMAWLRVAARLRERSDRLREAAGQVEEKLFGQLVSVVDLGLPGALDRGLRIAELARRVSERFQIPAHLLRDLEVAARLHELGRVVAPDRARAGADLGPWQYTQSTVAILGQADELAGAAELVASIYENWDGTGHPAHWRQGQIPLRCRILRVLVDFFAALARRGAPTSEQVIAGMQEHAGTLYDPMVIVHLKSVLGHESDGEWLGSSVLVPIEELRVGMVLAEDLYTNSGLKLLARDTALNPATLEVIQRRHRAEPILQGAAVLRKTA